MYNEQKELYLYITAYYPDLLTSEERATHGFHTYSQADNYLTRIAIEQILAKVDKAVIERNLSEGIDKFEQKILSKLSDKLKHLFINRCPQCGKIARTNKAKQCKFCGNDWH